MNNLIEVNSSFQLSKRSGKVLLIIGTSIHDQLNLAEYFVNKLEFIKLNQQKIFNKVASDISEEYFIKDIKFVSEITGKIYENYLELLSFLQKTNIAKLSKIYQPIYRQAQLANEIIIFRLYKEYFKEAQQIIISGKNCIIVENIFNDPFPRRKDIFFDYFNYFGDNFKILNVYSSMQNCILQSKYANSKFISYICSNDNIENIYYHINDMAIKNGFDEYIFENPLFNFEQFPLMFHILNQKPNTQIFEVIRGKDLKKIYTESISEIKKIFGFIVLKSYTKFYQKNSILNELGSQFLYLKNFQSEDEIYISNKRLIYHYNLILNGQELDKLAELKELIDSIKLWLDNKNYTYYNSSKYITNNINRNKDQIEYDDSPNIDIFTKKFNIVNKLISNKQLFIIDNVNNLNNNDILYKIYKPEKKENSTYYFLVRTSKGWVVYILSISKYKDITLTYYQNIEAPIAQTDENLIFINHLYISINKIIDKHFYIKIIIPEIKTLYKKIPELYKVLSLLNDRAPKNERIITKST